MKISCITTVFNEGPLLKRGIQSILAQTHSDLQFIIVDDGADEATRAALAAFDDDRIVLIQQANAGLSAARNKALEQVDGDYVCFMDADDCRPVWALEAIAATIRRDEPDLILCRGSLSEANGRLLPFYDDTVFEALLERCGNGSVDPSNEDSSAVACLMQILEPQVANKVIRTELIRRHYLRFPNGHFFEDILFHTLAIAHARRISMLDALCFTYFRQFTKPQITSTRDDRRFDILAVMKLTLEMFRHTKAFEDRHRRAATLAACMKLASWCGRLISHHHRAGFREMLVTVFSTADQRYLELPFNPDVEISEIARARDTLRQLGFDEKLTPDPA